MENETISAKAKMLIAVAALGYFVDVYDLILFSVVRNPSLMSLGLKGDELLNQGLNLMNQCLRTTQNTPLLLVMMVIGYVLASHGFSLGRDTGGQTGKTADHGRRKYSVPHFLLRSMAGRGRRCAWHARMLPEQRNHGRNHRPARAKSSQSWGVLHVGANILMS